VQDSIKSCDTVPLIKAGESSGPGGCRDPERGEQGGQDHQPAGHHPDGQDTTPGHHGQDAGRFHGSRK
jgi:hypothetical protein